MKRKKNRDIVKAYPARLFVSKLQRMCTAITHKQPFVIQVAGERITVPANATINIEHERSGAEEELEFQFVWKAVPATATPKKRSKRARSAGSK